MQLPTYDDVTRRRRADLEGHAHRTPVLTSRTLNEELGAQVFFKAENLQRMGAFKFRGGYNALSNSLTAQRKARASSRSRRATMRRRRAVRAAARLPATIVMPHDAPAPRWPPRAATAPRS
jgi:threonine dehydratase